MLLACLIIVGFIVTYPTTGSLLGGDLIYISGPCFDPNTQIIKCLFDDVEVAGNHVSNDQVTCVTPTVFWTGRVTLLVSVNGGESGGGSYDFQGIFTFGELIKPFVPYTTLKSTVSYNYPLCSNIVFHKLCACTILRAKSQCDTGNSDTESYASHANY